MIAAATEQAIVGDLVVVLCAAALSALVARRLGIAEIPAFLVAGAVLGPHALGLVPAPDALGAIAHLAVVFLLFGIGLELHLSVLRGSAARLVLAAAACVAWCTLAGWGIASAAGLAPPQALFVGMALALSSTAIVLKYFAARRALSQPVGRLSMAILVVQDLSVVGMLAAIPALAGWAGVEVEDGSTQAFVSLLDVVWRLGAVGGLVAFGRIALPRLMRLALASGTTELVLIVGGAFALGAAWVTESLGFSLEMGAFLAGFVLADTRFRHELAGQIVPLRDLFLAIFFTVIGMALDPAVVVDAWPTVLGATLALLAAKSIVIAGATWFAGVHPSVAIAAGLTLAQAGEFSLILLGEADRQGLVAAPLTAVLIAVVVLTLVLTPMLANLGRRAGLAFARFPLAPGAGSGNLTHKYAESPEEAGEGVDVVIAGFGPVGRRVAMDLDAAGATYAVIELNDRTVGELRANGMPAVLGDVQTESVLLTAGMDRAQALVLTVPDEAVARRASALARRLNPDTFIAVRVGFERAIASLHDAGANCVVVDELTAADRMADEVLPHLVPGEPAS